MGFISFSLRRVTPNVNVTIITSLHAHQERLTVSDLTHLCIHMLLRLIAMKDFITTQERTRKQL